MKERDYRYRNKKWQKYQYIDLKKTIKEIGEICGVSNGTIQYWLRKFKIEIRSLSKALKGRTLSEEHKQNISNSKKGKKQSEKTKKQISESIKKNGVILILFGFRKQHYFRAYHKDLVKKNVNKTNKYLGRNE